jgi:hypothetical protein
MILKQISKGDNHYLKKQQPSVGHNFERDTPRDYLCQVWTLHRCFLPSLAPFGQAVSEEKIFLTLANQKKELILVAMFVGRMEPNEEALVWVHFAKQFQRRRFF